MGRKKRYGNYWGDVQERASSDFRNACTQREYYNAYRILRPVLNTLTETILRIYFPSCPFGKQQNLMVEAHNECLVKLRSSFDPARATSYSFCSLITKNYYSDVLVKPTQRVFSIEYDYDVEDYDSFPLPIDTEQEPSPEAILLALDQLKHKYRQSTGSTRIIELVHDYVARYSCIADIRALFEYVYAGVDVKPRTLAYNFRTLFGVSIGDNYFITTGAPTSKNNLLTDDYCPNDNRNAYQLRYMRNKKIVGGQELLNFM